MFDLLFSKFDWETLLIVSGFVTVICYAIFIYSPYADKFAQRKTSDNIKMSVNKFWFILGISILGTFLQLGAKIALGDAYLWTEYVLKFVFTVFVAFLFFVILGSDFIQSFFALIKDKIIKK